MVWGISPQPSVEFCLEVFLDHQWIPLILLTRIEIFYTIWLFATAASLIYLAWDARGRLHLGLGAWFVWSLFLLGTGPVGLVFYWIAFKDIRRMPEGTHGEMSLTTWRAALAASAARASVYMLWFFYSLLFIIFVISQTGSPLVTLVMLYFLAFLIFWLISSITFKSRTGTSFWISMRSSFVTEYTALNLVFVGTLLTNLVLERVLPVLYADATHPVFWMRASISGFMGLLLYYPYAFWLRSRKFLRLVSTGCGGTTYDGYQHRVSRYPRKLGSSNDQHSSFSGIPNGDCVRFIGGFDIEIMKRVTVCGQRIG